MTSWNVFARVGKCINGQNVSNHCWANIDGNLDELWQKLKIIWSNLKEKKL